MYLSMLIASIKREIRKNGLKSFYIGLEFSLAHLSILKNKVIKTFYQVFSPVVIRNINGFKMSLDLRQKGIYEDLFFNGKREILLTNVMLNSNLIEKGDVVLDIGANIGYYALIESKLVGASGKVYAIEPVFSNFRNLIKNANMNNCKNIEFFHLAMDNKNGTSTIYVSDHPNWSSMMKNKIPGKVICRETVLTTTVDEFLRDKATPNLIHMDVEGYEYNIIKGTKETLKKNVKVLIEFHEFNLTKEQIEEFFETFNQYNYKVYFSIIDINEKPSKIRLYLMDKFDKKFGFLHMDMESLSKSLIEGKFSNPHICFIKTNY